MLAISKYNEYVILICSWCFLRGKQQSSSVQIEARDSSEDEAFWESMGNVISEDKVKLWEVAERILNQYL